MCLDGGIIAALLVFLLLVVAAAVAAFVLVVAFLDRWAKARIERRPETASADADAR